MTLPEVMATVAILGVIAAMAVARFTATHDQSRPTACHANQAEIELQTQLWMNAQGAYPAADLSDIGTNSSCFPGGVPVCPVDGTTYTIDTTTGLVIGHGH
jgi:prepilin-type N-terminal cleavage/methylation domain-containing protein